MNAMVKQNKIEEETKWMDEMAAEQEAFEMEHAQMTQDIQEMQEELDGRRAKALSALESALRSLKEWELTRKFASSLVGHATEQCGMVIDMMRDGDLWGPKNGPYAR